jgi:hypothetical protein
MGQVDLKSLLAFEGKPWTQLSKLALAVILAYSLLYLCTIPPVNGRWKGENIIFFKDGTHIPLQAFLRASRAQRSEQGTESNEAADEVQMHRYPEILELGVILLEIHLGRRLPCFHNDQGITNNNIIWASACEAYVKEKCQFISLKYRDAIEACLSPTFTETGSDVRNLRSELFKRVVRPLEEELVRNFPDLVDPDNLDKEVAEKCNLALSTPTNMGRSMRCQQSMVHDYDAVPLPQPVGYLKVSQAQEGRKLNTGCSERLLNEERNEGESVVRYVER